MTLLSELSTHAQHEYRALHDQLSKLTGAVVVYAGPAVDPGDEFIGPTVMPILDLKLPDGTTMTVTAMTDPEGNGPGHLHLEET